MVTPLLFLAWVIAVLSIFDRAAWLVHSILGLCVASFIGIFVGIGLFLASFFVRKE
jgi:hypothetical protein